MKSNILKFLFTYVFISLSILIGLILRSDNSILSYSKNYPILTKDKDLHNLVDQPYRFSFVAKSDNLGIINIKIISEKLFYGKVVFRFKPSDQREWTNINKYDSREFYYLSEFPFGIEKISDSKNKLYEVEIEIVENNEYADELYVDPHYLKTQHLEDRNAIYNIKDLTNLFLNKFVFSLNNRSFYKVYFLFFILLLILIFALMNKDKIICIVENEKLTKYDYGISVLIILDLFLLKTFNDFITLVIMFLIIRKILNRNQFKYDVLKLMSLLIIIALPFLLIDLRYVIEKIFIYEFYLAFCYILTEVIRFNKKNE